MRVRGDAKDFISTEDEVVGVIFYFVESIAHKAEEGHFFFLWFVVQLELMSAIDALLTVNWNEGVALRADFFAAFSFLNNN